MAKPLTDTGDYAWIMASAALVFMMVPGIALFYSGLRSQGTALSLIWLSMMTTAVVTIQWFLFGYSLVFSNNPNSQFIGDGSNGIFLGMNSDNDWASLKAPGTPGMVFGLFQGMFAAFTACLITGVVAEKGRLLPFVIFAFFWTSIVYDPIAYWMWNAGGWANKLGALDWAGGTPVHISSGAASLAYALALKYIRIYWPDRTPNDNIPLSNYFWPKRRSQPSKTSGKGETLKSHNMTNALLGTMLVWFGWFGFNAGSELHANIRAASTFIASNVAACSGGLTFTILEELAGGRWSGLGFCTGVFAGLVAITPAAGYVPAWAGLVIGPTASMVCFCPSYFSRLKKWRKALEEPIDIFIIHGLGGLWGMLMTGIFADSAVAALDGTVLPGGALNRNGVQIGYQIAGGAAGFAYSFIMTLALLVLMQIISIKVPSFGLRAELSEDGKVNLDREELDDAEAYRITCRHESSETRPGHTNSPELFSPEVTEGYEMGPLSERPNGTT